MNSLSKSNRFRQLAGLPLQEGLDSVDFESLVTKLKNEIVAGRKNMSSKAVAKFVANTKKNFEVDASEELLAANAALKTAEDAINALMNKIDKAQ